MGVKKNKRHFRVVSFGERNEDITKRDPHGCSVLMSVISVDHDSKTIGSCITSKISGY